MLYVLIITLIPITLSVMIHYEVLRSLYTRLPALTNKPRIIVTLGLMGALFAHIVETVIFGLGLMWLDKVIPNGQLLSATGAEHTLADYSYYSFVVYSSLGFGDMVPTGFLRLYTAMEVTTGLVLIAWTASFMYLQMVRYWGIDDAKN